MQIIKHVYGSETPSEWLPYFAESRKGDTYTCLVDSENRLIMSNTELESRTCGRCLKHAFGKVLMVGLGINLINDKVLDLDRVDSVDTVEISDWVSDNVPTKTNLLRGDYLTYEFKDKYDFIWFDGYGFADIELLKKLLKPGGQLMAWELK